MQARPDQILDYREYPVLYVDDEPESLRLFELSFRREFAVLTARSGDEALAKIDGSPIALVLAEHRMPGMTGIELLTRVQQVDPRTLRMLVTASGDAETLVQALNSGAVSRFVPKPWTPDELREVLRHGVEAYALDRERSQLLRELTLLHRVAKSLMQELALSPLLDLILSTAVVDLGFDSAALLFLDPLEERLCWERFAPREDEVSNALRRIELSAHTAPAFLRRLCNGEAQVLALDQALQLEGAMRLWVTVVAAEEILVVPLVGRGRTIGALALDNRRGGKRFTADDQTLLEGVANQAAISIENARLVEELRSACDPVGRSHETGTFGTLAAGLAHEINNPLVSIQTFVQLAPAKREEADAEFWGDYHSLACRELDRIRSLVATLQDLAPGAGRSAPREPIDLLELVKEVVVQLRPEVSQANVSLGVLAEPGAPKVVAAREQLHQVCVHLLRNAIQASPPGAEVAIRLGPDPASDGVMLEIGDVGEGIAEEILARIFEPFFSTRAPGQGSGLGLPVSQRLVTENGGSLDVRSREGEGTTVCVRLPAART
jgi:signal transduction histidine kinase/ActR/RegA family two-component response regulator